MKRFADEGYCWVCLACGKFSEYDKYQSILCPTWDESCILNSVLVKKENIKLSDDGCRAIEIKCIENEDCNCF